MSIKYYITKWNGEYIYKKEGNKIAVRYIGVDTKWFPFKFPGYIWRWRHLKRISEKEAFKVLL